MNTQRRNQNPTKHQTVTYGTESVSFIVNSSWGNWKNWQSLIISKKSSVKKLKTNTVHAGYAKPIFNVFFMKNMCCIGIETFLLSSSICLLYFSPLKGRCWLRNKMVSWYIKLTNLQTIFCLSFLELFGELVINWLFVIMKSYVKVNFKWIIMIIIIIIIIC